MSYSVIEESLPKFLFDMTYTNFVETSISVS